MIQVLSVGKKSLVIDEEKALYWLNNGATPSDTVKSLLSSKGIIEKYNNSKKSAKKVKEDK